MGILKKAALATATLAGLRWLERQRPLRNATQPLPGRAATDTLMLTTASVVNATLVSPAMTQTRAFANRHGVGIVPALAGPTWLKDTASIILLDASFYAWHRLMHRAGALWRLHLVHHIDPDMDALTAPRFHPGEMTASVIFRII